MPPIGLLTVAALLPQEWSFKLVDCMIRELDESDWDECDAVFISGMNVQKNGIIEAIKESKKREKLVVVGGPWVFHCPDVAFSEGADIVVKGEAENIIPELVKNIEMGASAVLIQSNEPANLHGTPPPRYDLVDVKQYLDIGIQFTRGCPFKCDFCDVIQMLGRKPRTKTANQIKNELQNILNSGWRNIVIFVDDNFIGNPAKVKKLLPEIIKWQKENGYPYRFYTQVSVNLAKERSVLELMAQAGFIKVYLGIESDESESNESVNKVQNVGLDMAEVCSNIVEVGIEVAAFFIIGFDGEKAGADRRMIDFITKNNIPDNTISMLQALPGTPLWKRLKDQNRLLEDSKIELESGVDTSNICNFLPARPVNEIAEELIRIHDVIYRPENYLKRVYKHVKSMKTKRRLPMLSANTIESKALAKVVFKWAFLRSSRFVFWKCLIGALLNFPERIDMFILGCLRGEHFLNYMGEMRKAVHSDLAKIK